MKLLSRKAILAAAVLSLAGMIAIPQLHAQAEAAASRPGLGQIQERMKQLFTEMNLSSDQQEKIRTIFQEQGGKMREIMQDQSLSREDRMKKAKEMGDQMDAKLKEVLTAEQYAQWKKKREEWQKQGSGSIADMAMERLKAVFSELNLSEEQQGKIKAVFESQKDKIRELAQDPDMSRETRMAKMRVMDDEMQPKFKEILTSEQYEKYQEKRKEQMRQASERLRNQ